MTRPQTVAEHSFRVAVIAKRIADFLPDIDGPTLASIIMWALCHDAAESKLGDLPNPAKKLIGRERWQEFELLACPWLTPPPEDSEISKVVELADIAEALSWIVTYGNGLRDKFNDESLEFQLRKRLYDRAREFGTEYINALHQMMGEVAP